MSSMYSEIRWTEKFYVVDANNTPAGPPSPISSDEGKVAVVRLAQAFEEVFGG